MIVSIPLQNFIKSYPQVSEWSC